MVQIMKVYWGLSESSVKWCGLWTGMKFY